MSIDVSGESFGKLTLRQGQFAGIPLPLGRHDIKLNAPYKNPVSRAFSTCEENDVIRWDVSASSDRTGASITKVEDEIVLGHGYGSLRVLTNGEAENFWIESDVLSRAEKAYKAPEVLALDSGLYRVVNGDQCVYLGVEPQKEAVLFVPGFASNVPVDRDCDPRSKMRRVQ